MWPSSNNNQGVYSNNQWSFNPALYQSIPYEQVDWATLAQQWIKMKETLPATNQGPPPPPAPQISKTSTESVSTTRSPALSNNDIEGGEAPMDMDTKDEDNTNPGVTSVSGGNWNQWGNWQSQWGWGWQGNPGTVPLAESSQSAPSSIDSKVKLRNNDSIPVLKNFVNSVERFPVVGSTGTSQVPGSFNYNNTVGGMLPPVLPKPGYWNENSFPSESYKGAPDTWIKRNKLPNRNVIPKPVAAEPYPVIDAVKKKQLPAWIREGLNKMEREKQKKLEKDRMVQEKMMMENMQTFDNDSTVVETRNNETFNQVPEFKEVPLKKSDITVKRSSQSPTPNIKSRNFKPEIPAIRKTKEEIMEESTLRIRRILTEILLEATESQVRTIAQEEYKRVKSTASALPIRKSNALASLTGNLGLNIYDSDSNSDDEVDRDDRGIDSDEELKMTIEKKQRDFEVIAERIDREIEYQEIKEKSIARDEYENEDEENTESDGRERDYDEPSREKITSNIQLDSNKIEENSLVYKSGEHQKSSNYMSDSKINGEKLKDRGKSKVSSNSISKKLSVSSSSSSASSSNSSSISSEDTSSGSDESSSSNSNSNSDSSGSNSSSSGSSSSNNRQKRKNKKRKNVDNEKIKKKRRSRSRSTKRRSRSRSAKRRSSSRSHHSVTNRKYKKPYDSLKRSSSSSSNRRERNIDKRCSPSRKRRSPSYHKRDKSKYYSPQRKRRRSPESKRTQYTSSSSRESKSRTKYSERKRR